LTCRIYVDINPIRQGQMADQRMQPGQNPMPFDGKRMIYGGFAPILDT
jgi:uncharacterized protein YbaA (DUF1428 family)